MTEAYVVIARHSMDDVPVYFGGRKECEDFARAFRTSGDWNVMHRQAERTMQTDLGTPCICLWVMRLSPWPIECVGAYDGRPAEQSEVVE